MPKRPVTCDRGTCYYTIEVDVPADRAAAKAAIDAAMAPHRSAQHGEAAAVEPPDAPELGGSSPTSWPPGSLDPAQVDPERIVTTHPDGSVAETTPVVPEGEAPPPADPEQQQPEAPPPASDDEPPAQ